MNRTREEIIKEVDSRIDQAVSSPDICSIVLSEAVLEVLLDIRDLLTNKQ